MCKCERGERAGGCMCKCECERGPGCDELEAGWAGGAGHEVCGQSAGCKGHHGIATGWPQGEHAYTGCVCKRVTVRQRCGEYGSKIALGFNHGKDQSQRGLGQPSHNTISTQKSLGYIFDTPQRHTATHLHTEGVMSAACTWPHSACSRLIV